MEKGQPLAAIYSPELLYVVREYQNAVRSGDSAIARNSAQRLVQYGLSAEQVASLAKQRENVFTIDLLAPISGTVVMRKAFKGQYIKTGEPLFEMGNLSRLWFHAEVYERDLPDIRIGQKAVLRTPTVPGREFEGVVTFVDPNFDPRTRSTKVRIEVDNPPAEGEGRGLTRVLPHLRRIAVRTQEGLPIYLEDIAEISIGGDFRRGALDVDGREVVGGVVVMRTGENAMQVIQRGGQDRPEPAQGRHHRSDPAPVEMIETTIMLKPQETWRAGVTKEKIIAELSEKMSLIPGYVPGFLQPIENRILMLSTGIRAQVGIKILGADLETIQQVAYRIEDLVRKVPGATRVAASRTQGKPYVEILPDRLALARYGLNIRDLMDVVEIGLGGLNVSTTIEGRARYPIQLRLARDERDDIEKIGNILVPAKGGFSVPLGQVASIRRSSGASEISSEDGLLRVFVQSNVLGRDLGGFVREVQQRIAQAIELPPGVTLKWSGQYESQLSAQRTLMLIVPVVLLIIFMLLSVVFRSVMEAAHVILAVPFALTGGALLQYLLGYNFSVAVWIGYIALFGTAIQTGVVMVVYLEEALKKKMEELGNAFRLQDLKAAVIDGAMLRLRPKVMTVGTVVASLLPIMWSTRTGAEVMKPLATPVIGGMLSSLVHVLIVTPVIFYWLRRRTLKL